MRWVVVLVAVLVGLGAGMLAALEGAEVVVLRTGAPGAPRETRVWVADADGAWWIEAANPSRPFLRELGADDRLEVRRFGRWHRCRATVAPDPGGHERIRRLLRARYGWRDSWIGWLADTTRSRAVRLDCEAT
jgi:hypothetical protein